VGVGYSQSSSAGPAGRVRTAFVRIKNASRPGRWRRRAPRS